MKKGIVLFIIAVVILYFTFNCFFCKKPESPVKATQTSFLYDETNRMRKENGIDLLKYSQELERSATVKACDLRDRNYWAHQAPDGQMSWHLFNEAGYYYIFAGENLARNLPDEKIIGAFMESPTHRANVLGKQFDDLGIGKCGRFVVFHFGRSQNEKSL